MPIAFPDAFLGLSTLFVPVSSQSFFPSDLTLISFHAITYISVQRTHQQLCYRHI